MDSGTIQSSLFREARDVGGLERDSSAATGVPGLVWGAVFTPDLGVAWDIEARHKLRSLRRCQPSICAQKQCALVSSRHLGSCVHCKRSLVCHRATRIVQVAAAPILRWPTQGRSYTDHLPKVVMASFECVLGVDGVVHVNVACWLLHLRLRPVLSWMGAFLGATSPKRTMVFGSWLGPQCQSYQQDQKTWQRSRPAIDKFQNKLTKERRSQIKDRCMSNGWLSLKMERPHTFKMVLKGLYIWLVHQDLQKKKEIEIVKRSRNSGKVFATKLFTVCYQCIGQLGLRSPASQVRWKAPQGYRCIPKDFCKASDFWALESQTCHGPSSWTIYM